MPNDSGSQLGYLYHKMGGKIVMDRALHTNQARQHYGEDPNFKEDWVAFTMDPLTRQEKDAFSASTGMQFDESPRPTLKGWTPPTATTRPTFSLRRAGAPAGSVK